MNTFKRKCAQLAVIALGALALTGCGYDKYLKQVDSANAARVSIVKEEQKSKVAESVADETGFKALEAAAKSADPVVAAISASQLGTILAVRAVSAKYSGGKSAASSVQNPEKPVDPLERAERLLVTGAQVALGIRQIDATAKVQMAAIQGETDRSVSRDQTVVHVANTTSSVVSALAGPLSVPTTQTTVTADRGANVNVGGSQTVSPTTTTTTTVTCTTGNAGGSGQGGLAGGPVTPTTPVPSGGTTGPGGSVGGNNCSLSQPSGAIAPAPK